MTNAHHTVLYVGVTSAIDDRVEQHATHYFKNSFTDKCNCIRLLYLEHHPTIVEAIAREKQIKSTAGKRKKR